MSRLISPVIRTLVSLATLAVACAGFSGRLSAQQSVAIRVLTDPAGPSFEVDGQLQGEPFAALWPVGSRHSLSVQQVQSIKGIIYTFKQWQFNGTSLAQNAISVTADPAISEYRALFSVQYNLSAQFNNCPAEQTCDIPGYITVNGAPVYGDLNGYYSPGAVLVLQAFPNPGWVFEGWEPGPSQSIQGVQNTVTVNGAVTVHPVFRKAYTIRLATSPPGLKVLADRAEVITPVDVKWGVGSTHSIGVLSPQQDILGTWWAFSSWSDGGAQNHAYTVPLTAADTLTAVFVPAEHVAIVTSPPNLKLKIDGRDDWLGYVFRWGVGEKHRIEAPDQQTDAQGRVWGFGSWSVGGPPAQDLTIPATADGNYTVTATYGPVGHLTVSSWISGVNVKVDGADCQTPCDVRRAVGTAVRLVAPASVPRNDTGTSRADFSGWSGDGGTSASAELAVTLDAKPLAVSLGYRTMNRLALISEPAGAADWRVSPVSADGFYDSSATVNVSAVARSGFRFRAWTGDLSGASSSGAVSMDAPRMVRALFDSVPSVSASGVVNAASGTAPDGIAPGSLVSIFGVNLADSTVAGQQNPLPQTLGGVTVEVAGRWLPILFVSPAQINVQLPADLPLGPQTLIVSAAGQPDAAADFTVVRDAPGLFQQVVDGRSYAVAFHENGSLVTSAVPARRGELLSLYGTGFGPTDRARPLGFPVPADPPYALLDTATVMAGDAGLQPERGFAAPGYIGIDILQFRLSNAVSPAADVPLRVTIQGKESNVVLLPVE